MGSVICIYGAGGHAKVVYSAALLAGYSVAAFIADTPDAPVLKGINVIDSAKLSGQNDSCSYIVAIGDNHTRARIFENLACQSLDLVSVIHPSSCRDLTVQIGRGTFVGPGVIVNTDAVIGLNCILNTACSVDHDCVIGSHAHICPGVRLAGNVTVGEGSMIGTGAVVIPGTRIGRNVVVGAGSVVIKDLPDNTLAYGAPARVIKHIDLVPNASLVSPEGREEKGINKPI